MGKRQGPKWYAVALGRQPGVYTTWSECESQVKGFANAVFKSFKTEQEAIQFADSNEMVKEEPQSQFENEFGDMDETLLSQSCDATHASQPDPAERQPPQGECFYYPKGKCFKGAQCTYRHVNPDGTSNDPPKIDTPRLLNPPKVAPCSFQLRKSGAAAPSMPASAAGCLKHKQNVSLCVRNGEVLFQFNYVKEAIDAIKICIKGRRWEAAAKQWAAPLESLPDCVALYEHFGRVPDKAVKQRAVKMAKSVSSARPDDINLVVEFGLGPLQDGGGHEVLGRARLAFHYDASVVAALKQLHPASRAWNPGDKSWCIDFLCLGELLDALAAPDMAYETPATLLRLLDTIGALAVSMQDDTATSGTGGVTTAAKAVVGAMNAGRLPRPTSSGAGADRSDAGQQAKRRRLTPQQELFAAGGREAVAAGLARAAEWAENGFDGDEGYGMDFCGLEAYAKRNTARDGPPPTDCDCGHPEKHVGGRHVCRYYGSFECGKCSNRWTSAFTWRGEKQACRRCEVEALPCKTEPLQKRDGASRGNAIRGAHDCSRCSKCRSMRRDCTGGRGTWSN